jgi:hypothetical protein
VKCNAERAYIPQRLGGGSAKLRCSHCGEEAPPRASKLLNRPTINPLTGRGHQSKAEANVMGKVYQARELGLIEDVRGLDRGDPQETFRLDVYGNQAVEALVCKVEDVYSVAGDTHGLLVLARDVRRSKVHICNYRCDSSWTSKDPGWGPVGDKKVIDVKGRRDGAAYRMFQVKQRLMLSCWGHEVEEWSGRGVRFK